MTEKEQSKESGRPIIPQNSVVISINDYENLKSKEITHDALCKRIDQLKQIIIELTSPDLIKAEYAVDHTNSTSPILLVKMNVCKWLTKNYKKFLDSENKNLDNVYSEILNLNNSLINDIIVTVLDEKST